MNLNNKNKSTPPELSWVTKARYVGTGLIIGVIIAPVVRELLAKLQPKLDALLEKLTGQTEGYAEKASDILHKAKEYVRNADPDLKKKNWPHSQCASKDDSHEHSQSVS
jgi:uncharacterized membrane-anchored protein YhcB (DUF1043 family)